jgi:hypothetical protein
MRRLATFVTLITLLVPTAVLAATDAPSTTTAPTRNPRVRPHDTRSAALLLDGLQRSDTLRALVARIEDSDVIVYLQMDSSLNGLAGKLTWVTATPYVRYVRISVSPSIARHAAIAALAHELYHAVEVASEPSIIDAQSLEAFYKQHGISMRAHRNGWDTEAAREAGDDVRNELATPTRGCDPCTIV